MFTVIFMLRMILGISVLGFMIWAGSDCFGTIDRGRKGAVKRFGRRTGRVIDEGLYFKWPLIEDVDVFLIKRFLARADFSFVSKGEKSDKSGGGKQTDSQEEPPGLEVFVEGEILYEPDLEVFEPKDKNGKSSRPIYVRTSESPGSIEKDLVESTKSIVGDVGSLFPGRQFVNNRKVLHDLISCFLRLPEPPHVTDGIPADGILKYYKDHSVDIDKMLRGEGDKINERSPVEERNGINVVVFNLGDVHFSKDVQEALEEEEETKTLADVAKDRVTVVKDMLADIPGGVSDQRLQMAMDFVSEIMTDTTRRNINSIQGGALPLVQIGATSGKQKGEGR